MHAIVLFRWLQNYHQKTDDIKLQLAGLGNDLQGKLHVVGRILR